MYIGQSEWRAGCGGPYRSHRIRPFIGVHRTVRMEGGGCGGLIGLTV